MTTFVTIIYIIVALFMVLVILLQSGKGGGIGSALGGGASQTVFGGGGGGDFMAKLTQGFAATFMITAMYLAYDSAHTGSELLQEASQDNTENVVDEDQVVNYEAVGPNPLRLPPAGSRSEAGEAEAEPVPEPTGIDAADPDSGDAAGTEAAAADGDTKTG